MTGGHNAHWRRLSRRAFCTQTLAGAGFGAVATMLRSAEPGPTPRRFVPAELQAMGTVATNLMQKHNVPGLSVAIAKEGRLVYTKGFGLANKEDREQVTPAHLFRIASLSKPITATTIFRLIEAGRLRLADKVFGRKGLLRTDYGKPPYAKYVDEITVEHLLTHTSGGWQNDDHDPMFDHPGMNHKQLITWTLANQPLTIPPGKRYAYSNFGFCILGRVIEKLTRHSYADAVQKEVLSRCNISTMRIGGNTRAERAPGEVSYYSQEDESPYDMDVRRMDSHGGWLATAVDLVKFLVHVDGFLSKPDILTRENLESMTSPSSASDGYAKGWCINRFHNWWHTGSLPGTTTIMVRTAQQFCWAALTNTRGSAGLSGDLDQMMWEMVGKSTTWPDHDLFSPLRSG